MKANLSIVLLGVFALVSTACAGQRGDFFHASVNLPGFHREVIETPQTKVVVNYDNGTATVNGQPARLVVVQPTQPAYGYANGMASGPYYPVTSTATSRSRYTSSSDYNRNGYTSRQAGTYDYSSTTNDPNIPGSYGREVSGTYDYRQTSKVYDSGAYYSVNAINQRQTDVVWGTGNGPVYGVETRTYNTSGVLTAGFSRQSGMTKPGWHPHELDMIYRR